MLVQSHNLHMNLSMHDRELNFITHSTRDQRDRIYMYLLVAQVASSRTTLCLSLRACFLDLSSSLPFLPVGLCLLAGLVSGSGRRARFRLALPVLGARQLHPLHAGS